MKSFRIAPLAMLVLGPSVGCLGYEYTHSSLEPERTLLPPPVLARPDTLPCLKEGSEIVPASGPDASPAPVCCDGLTRAEVYKGSILRLDVCEPEGTGHAFCILCGDGRCGVGENTCSCMADCQWP